MNQITFPTFLKFVLLGVIFYIGCEKEDPTAGQSPKPAKIQPVPVLAGQEDVPLVPVPPANGAPGAVDPTSLVSPDEVDEDGKNVMLEALNSALRAYVKDNETVPQSLKELVEAGYLPRVPNPPAGKRYSIERASGAVILVNN